MSAKTLLYVEDEANDILLLQLGLQKAGLSYPLHTVDDGQKALDYLSGSGPYADREQHPLPDLVFLDLNLPCLSGMKVLQWIREQPRFASLPVVMYTSSDHPDDMESARQLGVSEYVLKPSRISQIAEMVQRVTQQWLQAGEARKAGGAAVVAAAAAGGLPAMQGEEHGLTALR